MSYHDATRNLSSAPGDSKESSKSLEVRLNWEFGCSSCSGKILLEGTQSDTTETQVRTKQNVNEPNHANNIQYVDLRKPRHARWILTTKVGGKSSTEPDLSILVVEIQTKNVTQQRK
jgi:ethanolamine ammonia-lyase small subunit